MRIEHDLNLLVFKFLACGGLATSLHWSLMCLLIMAGTVPVLATTLGTLTGAIANYWLQYHIAFRCDADHRNVAVKYALACLFGVAVNAAIFTFSHQFVGLSVLVSQVCATSVMTILNFALYKRSIFCA